FSLFQIMTLDNWEQIVKPVVEKKPFAYLFFIPFVIVSAYVILNIFIAIIVNGMREARKKNESAERKKAIKEAVDEEDRKNEAKLATVIDKLNELEALITSQKNERV
ncbi:MAG: ion transporter, partial [Desulfovibrio sp.]|nr:ion transporter [Desulfovibrio sp.]